MKALPVSFASVLALIVPVSSAVAQTPFDGLYQPKGMQWSCREEFIGMDGGAVAILDGYLEGVENRCELTSPRPTEGGTLYTAICSGEGESYSELIVLSKTDDGVSLQRGSYITEWSRCGQQQAASYSAQALATPPEGRWYFNYNDRRASILANGNLFALSCELFNPSSMYPTAIMSIPCAACFPEDVTRYTFKIDGEVVGAYDFERISNAEGSKSDLDYYPEWYRGLVAKLMAGSELEVIQQGYTIATFPLAGSRRAISQLRTTCN